MRATIATFRSFVSGQSTTAMRFPWRGMLRKIAEVVEADSPFFKYNNMNTITLCTRC